MRITVRLMGFPTRETNSSQASSSRPAQRQTMSFRDNVEYLVGLDVLNIFHPYAILAKDFERAQTASSSMLGKQSKAWRRNSQSQLRSILPEQPYCVLSVPTANEEIHFTKTLVSTMFSNGHGSWQKLVTRTVYGTKMLGT